MVYVIHKAFLPHDHSRSRKRLGNKHIYYDSALHIINFYFTLQEKRHSKKRSSALKSGSNDACSRVDIEFGKSNCFADKVIVDMSLDETNSKRLPFLHSLSYDVCAPDIVNIDFNSWLSLNDWFQGILQDMIAATPLLHERNVLNDNFVWLMNAGYDIVSTLDVGNIIPLDSGASKMEILSLLLLYLVANSPDNKYCAYVTFGDNGNTFVGSFLSEFCIETTDWAWAGPILQDWKNSGVIM